MEQELQTISNGLGDDFEDDITERYGLKITWGIRSMFLGDKSYEGLVEGFKEITFLSRVFHDHQHFIFYGFLAHVKEIGGKSIWSGCLIIL